MSLASGWSADIDWIGTGGRREHGEHPFWLEKSPVLRQSAARPVAPTENWEEHARAALYRARIVALEREQAQMEGRIKELAGVVDSLVARCAAMEEPVAIFPIATFAPELYEIAGPIHVVIRRDGDSYTASFVEANINASGDTQHEAFEMVKDMILATFDRLAGKADAQLGPGPLRQKRVLTALIHERP